MHRFCLFLALLLTLSPSTSAQTPEPAPGTVYREYALTMDGNNWRVTDPNAVEHHDGAADFLPNPVLELDVERLEGATRAELLIDRWGGHVGTQGLQLRFNENAWIDLPTLSTTPEGSDPSCYLFQDNPIVEVPLTHLQEGINTLEGMSGNQDCHGFNWGQWGWYGVVLRVYYDEDAPHPLGRIVSPQSGAVLSENPVIEVEAYDTTGAGIDRIDVLAYYEGYDEDGDGLFADWHGHLHYADLSGHVGSLVGPPLQEVPYSFRWDTRYVPDQAEGDVRLIARIRDTEGRWYVTEPVEGLSLKREGATVRFVPPQDVPEAFWVRDGDQEASRLLIPDDYDPTQVEEVALHLRTWNGHNHGTGTLTRVGDWTGALPGIDHNYAYTIYPLPPEALKPGETEVGFHSETHHHGVELLWPGPALTIRYRTADRTSSEDRLPED